MLKIKLSISNNKLFGIYNAIVLSIIISGNIFSQNEYPNLDDQSGGITEGYGAWGTHSIVKENYFTIPDKGIITFYHPNETASKRATVFFISGWGKRAETYDKFFRFIVSHGYPLVNIYNNDDSNGPGYVGNISVSYPNIVDMIKTSYSLYSNWIDTSKIGLMGHSFGGGATIWVGDTLFNNKTNWGTNGRFIFTSAPWLSFLVSKDDLENYPPNVKLHVQVSMDEVVSTDDTTHWTWLTDPRAIRAVFELINIPDDDKDYIRVFSDQNRSYQYNGKTYTYDADHFISYAKTESYHPSYSQYEPYDEMDVYVINRLAHAMMDYVFEGNEDAKTVALGNGSNEQEDVGMLPDLEVTDRPIITRPVEEYKYTCYEGWDPDSWKLEKYCDDTDGNGLIDSLEFTLINEKYSPNRFNNFSLSQNYSNPFNPSTTIEYSIPANARNENIRSVQLRVYDILGREVATLVNKKQKPGNYKIVWNAENQSSGVYYFRITTENISETKRMILMK